MTTKLGRGVAILFMALGAAMAAASCSNNASDSGTDSNTHWLKECDRDSECGGLKCICGACTRACSDVSACSGLANAACAPSPGCGATPPAENSSVCVAAVVSGAGGTSGAGGISANGGSTPAGSGGAFGGGGTSASGGNGGGSGGDQPDASFDSHCEPLDARTGPLPCTTIVGSTWDGVQCKDIVCSCDGTQCDQIYQTMAACQSAHADCPATVAPKNCTTATDCTIVPRGCCGACGTPHLDQVLALRKDAADAYTAARCDGNGACPPCIPGENPDLGAECVEGECKAYEQTTLP